MFVSFSKNFIYVNISLTNPNSLKQTNNSKKTQDLLQIKQRVKNMFE